MKKTLVLAALLISACASLEAYQQEMDSYKGKSEGELIAGLGVPDKTIARGGLKYFEYSDKGKDCQTTFTLKGDIVTKWQSNGESCSR